MREIKFRAWVNDTMIKPMSIQKMIHQKVNTLSLGTLESEVIFMQYTGLKDKNGVDIYEGDIVKNVWGKVSEIIFDEDYSKYEAFEEDFSWVVSDTFEVIGNIYENTELLKED